MRSTAVVTAAVRVSTPSFAKIADIGVGGAPSGDLDEKYATTGLATLK
ncbi:hypothetical protein ACFOWZ_03215 [Lentzea rhizosphaerae]|uniref:Uncharacterized protein n=1 Tax=Lentzea rhizosphaerae TaxID=2041025 RepID=A0ABV8BJU0_9PSEU